jgi:hypothetical protein
MTTTKTLIIGTLALILVGAVTWRFLTHDDRVAVCKYLTDPEKRHTPAGQIVAAADGDISNLRALVSGLGDAAGTKESSPNTSKETKTTSQQTEGACS